MEQAKSENLIVCLPTGSGKTFIAIMLIKELLPITQQSLTDGGKRTILLTKTGIGDFICTYLFNMNFFFQLNLLDNITRQWQCTSKAQKSLFTRVPQQSH